MKRILLAATLLLFSTPSALLAQTALAKPGSEAYTTIAALDTAVFKAYNTCDLTTFASYLEKDLEFYHDQGGLMVGADATVAAVQKNICGKVTRELVPGSLQIYPMRGYGALEIGVHRFHHPGHDDTEPLGEGKFIHLWHLQDGKWKLARIISFDHFALPVAGTKK